jgi:adenylosuccinate synthase
VTPVYETTPGWSGSLRGCRRFGDLPSEAQGYVRLIGELLGAPVRIIGVGQEREHIIYCDGGA